MSPLPPARRSPCGGCPWRTVAIPGWLGPWRADEWIALAHSDEPIACHESIQEDDSWEGALQCAGSAVYRANVCKLPRNPEVAVGTPDRQTIFAKPSAFLAHHKIGDPQ